MLAWVGACSSFGTDPSTSTLAEADDGSAPPVIVTTEVGTPVNDAAGSFPEDAGGADANCDAFLCESFDEPGWERRWNVVPPMNTSTADYVSPPASLALDLEVGGERRFIDQPLVGKSVVAAEVRMKVLARGADELDIFSLGDTSSTTYRGIFFVHSGAFDQFSVQVPLGAGDETLPLMAEISDWTTIRIEADLVARTYAVRVNGALQHQGPLDPGWMPSGLHVLVGAPWVASGGPKSAWRIRFDDLRVEAR